VPDRHALADDARDSFLAVQHRSILHVAVLADLDAINVAAQHRGGPDARARTEVHVADDYRGLMYERRRIYHEGVVENLTMEN
jgi:hypothetical protein